MKQFKKIHFISIGGSVMHNLAIALHKKGYLITGSDDEIYEPSRGRLDAYGLLPKVIGWNENNITPDIDAIILGMHARPENPELIKAQEMGIPVFSYPEFVYMNSKEKTRVVIAGSHGKTTTTSMVMHVLKYLGRDFDYLVGAQLDGFDTMVQLSDAPVIIIEGDEYLSSPVDRRPKFLHYKPHLAVLTGIAWDHINVFPTFEGYLEQFELFIQSMPEDGQLFYYHDDKEIEKILRKGNFDTSTQSYSGFEGEIKNGHTFIRNHLGEIVSLQIFGQHNLANLKAAYHLLKALDVSDEEFFGAIPSFKGASKRQQVIYKSDDVLILKDFAHAPSKVSATVQAVKAQYPDRQLIACVELHTFSSLNKKFLPQYQGALDAADIGVVFFSDHTLEMKKLEPISKQDIRDTFENPTLEVFKEANALSEFLETKLARNTNLLVMSSGNFGGLQLENLVAVVR